MIFKGLVNHSDKICWDRLGGSTDECWKNNRTISSCWASTRDRCIFNERIKFRSRVFAGSLRFALFSQYV